MRATKSSLDIEGAELLFVDAGRCTVMYAIGSWPYEGVGHGS